MINKEKEHKKAQVKIIMVNEMELYGTVTIPSKGYHSRLSDWVNNSQPFLILTEAKIYQKKQLLRQVNFLCLNKQSIMLLTEEEG